MGKGKPQRNQVLTVNLKHDGVFTMDPFHYLNGDKKKIENINFEGTLIRIGITTLKNVADVDAIVNLGYRNKLVVDLYVDHNSYDSLDIRDQAKTLLMIKTLTTNDSFPNKLCSNNGHFRGFINEHVNGNVERVVEDTKSIDHKFDVRYKKVKRKSCVKGNYVITKSKANNGKGTSKSSQTTTKSLQTTSKSGEGYSQSPKWTKSRISSNRGSTYKLDDEETSSGNNYFRRIHACFKAVRMVGMWQLYGIPCVHLLAAYCHMNRDPVEGVDHCTWIAFEGNTHDLDSI
nr:zinc finger, PMZ-type [Tanacetum cinerariifolium]